MELPRWKRKWYLTVIHGPHCWKQDDANLFNETYACMYIFFSIHINILSNTTVFKNGRFFCQKMLIWWTQGIWANGPIFVDLFYRKLWTIKSKHFASNPFVELSCLDIQMHIGLFPKRYIVVQIEIKLGDGTRWLQKSLWFCSVWKCVSDCWAGGFVLAGASLVWYHQL